MTTLSPWEKDLLPCQTSLGPKSLVFCQSYKLSKSRFIWYFYSLNEKKMIFFNRGPPSINKRLQTTEVWSRLPLRFTTIKKSSILQLRNRLKMLPRCWFSSFFFISRKRFINKNQGSFSWERIVDLKLQWKDSNE